jgi:hypothetical protein
MRAYETSLAAEFHVLSVLHRLGANAALTLANKKTVDIVVARESGGAATLDVKGAAGTTGFFVDNQLKPRGGHFVVFVSYLNRIDDPSVAPEVYIVPSACVRGLAQTSPGGKSVVRLTSLRRCSKEYRDAWKSVI